ncbi:MAG TPA: alpha-glucan family phosphorylase [Solirubrobacteraceae bacterium]|nr:alpha-glucan family phosphorylase [Solirubrobacteraceae bacterium]
MENSIELHDGLGDLERAAGELAERVPAALAPLARVAYNYRWTWTPGGHELFSSIDPERFERCAHNPVRLLLEARAGALRRAAGDPDLCRRAAQLERTIADELARPVAETPIAEPASPVAFLCAEYGVHVSLPIYSGGLGALAGDILKEASDLALPLVAAGLMYNKGYFRQRVDASGWQHEYWLDTDPELLPAALVTGEGGSPLTISVPIGEREVAARVWRVQVGRVPLFLLDTRCPQNGPLESWITARLYDADPQVRLAQYALLGVGGVRALRAMGYEPAVVHLNEGHAALAPLELARDGRGRAERRSLVAALQHAADSPAAPERRSLRMALDRARQRTVFTTHTPVPAGNDVYPADDVQRALGGLAAQLGGTVQELIELGHDEGADGTAPFGVTQAALRMSRASNGVSRRHGEVAREMWASLWPGRQPGDVPIGHVTNGVHVPTWIGPQMRALLDAHLPADWLARADEPTVWEAVDAIPAAQLWGARCAQRRALVELVRRRSVCDRLMRGDLPGYVDAAARAFDPDVMTIGFARRVATYKRLELLARDPERTLSLLDGERPVQVVLAGKAHPRDEEAKRSLQAIFGLKGARAVAERVVFLDDYDLATGAALVRGCDLWLNLPRPPLEASGTSGMKSVFNGGLQLSVLDGWWAEGYDGSNGWAIPGDVDVDHEAQDERDAALFHRLMAEDVLPAFYERDEAGLPQRWLEMIRASLRTLGPRFCATRMVHEYLRGPWSGGAGS